MSAEEFTLSGGAPLRGRLRVPGDKGIAHRSLIFAAMAVGTSRIADLPGGADVAATRACLESYGVVIHDRGPGAVEILGGGTATFLAPHAPLDCANSGTTMRLFSGLASGLGFRTELTGDASLSKRPMGRVVEPLRAMGARIEAHGDGAGGSRAGDGDCAPLEIHGGGLTGIEYEMPVASAQVKTALVLAGLQAEGRTVITEPAPSRDHTERLLTALGAPLERLDATTIAVEAGAPSNFDLEIPGDPSSAAFFAVAASIVEGSDLRLTDVSVNPTRIGFVDVLARMGADITVTETGVRLGEPVGEIRVRSAALVGTTIGGDEIPNVIDELPVLAVAAAVADGTTVVTDAAELRVKETDRIGAIEQELGQLGVGIEATPDGFTVRGGARPNATVLKSHGDHRIAMAAAVAALTAEGETTIRGWQSVRVSYPDFAADLEALREGE